MAHLKKHPNLFHGGSWKLTLPSLTDVLVYILLLPENQMHVPLRAGRQKLPLWSECGYFRGRPNLSAIQT